MNSESSVFEWLSISMNEIKEPTMHCPHRHSSLLSAYGMALADVVVEHQLSCTLVFNAGLMKVYRLSIVENNKE